MSLTIQMVGGGRMGAAMVGGLVAGGFCPPSEILIVEPSDERRQALAEELPGVELASEPVGGLDTVVAVKPGIVGAVVAQLAQLGATRVLSIAAGVRIATLEAPFEPPIPVVRAMPNTPALVGKAATAIAAGTVAAEADVAWAVTLLEAVGSVSIVSEAQLDAVTGLSGSGPAYVFLMAEAMIEAGVLQGLARDTSAELVRQTLLGAATQLSSGDLGPEALRAAVTSPGGTTAAGLRALERHGFRAALIEAIADATERSQELGGG